jgi:hypothetical protein
MRRENQRKVQKAKPRAIFRISYRHSVLNISIRFVSTHRCTASTSSSVFVTYSISRTSGQRTRTSDRVPSYVHMYVHLHHPTVFSVLWNCKKTGTAGSTFRNYRQYSAWSQTLQTKYAFLALRRKIPRRAKNATRIWTESFNLARSEQCCIDLRLAQWRKCTICVYSGWFCHRMQSMQIVNLLPTLSQRRCVIILTTVVHLQRIQFVSLVSRPLWASEAEGRHSTACSIYIYQVQVYTAYMLPKSRMYVCT